MTAKRFSVRTEPLVAEIGEHSLYFMPEAGDEFLDAYDALLTAQKTSADGKDSDAKGAKESVWAARRFLAEMALEDSHNLLLDPGFSLPIRVVTELVEWLTQELTGSDKEDGTKGARPTGRR